MQQRQVNEYKQELHEILAIQNYRQQWEKAQALQKRMGINVPLAIGDSEQRAAHGIIGGIRADLQTETMINTCSTAKRSCKWAALAAIAALIAATLSFLTMTAAWVTVWLMLKSV